jgi:hypothetical protein
LVAKRKSPEEIAEDEARTSPTGMYNVADAYLISARTLGAARLKHGFAKKPVWFLYFHSVELYLKAFLRLQRLTVEQLSRRPFGHDINALGMRAKELGLVLDAEDDELFRIMGSTDVMIRARYNRTGKAIIVNFHHLDVAAEHLHDEVGAALRRSGQTTRPLPH